MWLLGRYGLEGTGKVWPASSYDWMNPLYDPVLELHAPSTRPAEMQALEWKMLDGREDAWAQGEGADDWERYPQRIEGLHLVAEVSRFVRPERTWCEERRIRGVVSAAAVDGRESLSISTWLTQAGHLRGSAMDEHQVFARNGSGMLKGGVYGWAALNPRLAGRLGWARANGDPFGWRDPDGRAMVKSIYWRDGWTGVAPPRWDVLGEGWCLLATEAAVEAIVEEAAGAAVRLAVRRQRRGEETFDESWFLERPLYSAL